MAPLPISILKDVPSVPPGEPLAVKNTLSSPSSVVLESVLGGTLSSFPLPLLITPLIFIALYISIPRILNWRYPVQSVETVQGIVDDVGRLIRDNSSVVTGRKLSKESERNMKARLRPLHAQVTVLKNRTEPPRSNFFAWAVYRLKMVRDVDECYFKLKKLEAEVQDKLDHTIAQDEQRTLATEADTNRITARNRAGTIRAYVELN